MDDKTTVPFPSADFTADMTREEGIMAEPYRDTVGLWTIGIGHLIGDDHAKAQWLSTFPPRLTGKQVQDISEKDVAVVLAELDQWAPWWRTLSPVRQCVMASMTFQLGGGWLHGIKAWPFTLGLIKDGMYAAAATQMKLSLWARQCPNRAARMCWMMRADNRDWPKELAV